MNHAEASLSQPVEKLIAADIASIAELRAAITQEILHYLNLPRSGWLGNLCTYAFRPPAERFARLGAQFDAIVDVHGFRCASHWALSRFMHSPKVSGKETIPKNGPLLIVTNHPGTFDAFLIAANLPRDDFKTIARGMDFLRGLPATRQSLIFSTRDPHVKMVAAREAIRHLQSGGSLLVFPTGTLDPDPACLPGAAEALDDWSASLDLLLRRVPEAQVQVAMLGGLLAPECLSHPLARFRETVQEQQIVAEIFQVIQQLMFKRKFSNTPRLVFSSPVAAVDLAADRPGCYLPEILAIARKCLTDVSSC